MGILQILICCCHCERSEAISSNHQTRDCFGTLALVQGNYPRNNMKWFCHPLRFYPPGHPCGLEAKCGGFPPFLLEGKKMDHGTSRGLPLNLRFFPAAGRAVAERHIKTRQD
jgi:hypothetical protein